MKFALSDLKLTSPAFAAGGPIPTKYTGEGEDISPQLQWENIPAGTRSLAIICHDPDAPVVACGGYGFVHWVLYNLPGSLTGLEENGGQNYASGANDFGNVGYGGPMPPNGHGTHHYYFWVLALDSEPNLEPGLSLSQLLEKIEPQVLGMNRLIGTYERA